MNKKLVATIVFFLLLLFPVIGATQIPSNETLRLFEEFKAKYGTPFEIKWHKYIDSPSVLHGFFPTRENITNKDEAAETIKKFIEENKVLFKINTSELKLSGIVEDWESYDVYYQQYYQDVPIERARVSMLIQKSGEITSIGNSFYPNISIPTTPIISKDEAIVIAKNYYASRHPGVEPSLVILSSDYIELGKVNKSDTLRYYLAWKVWFDEKTIYVDAENGNILMVADNHMVSIPESSVDNANITTEVNATKSKADIEQNESYNITPTENLTQPSEVNETSALQKSKDIQQNESYTNSPQTDINFTQKFDINKIPLYVGLSVMILIVLFTIALFLKRGGKSGKMA